MAGACAVTLAAACGSSSTGGNSSSSVSSQQPASVTLAFPLYGAGDVPFFLAQQLGYNKAEGIDVKFTTVTSSVALSALTRGDIQFAYTTVIRPVATLGQGERFYAFMPVNLGFTDDVIMSKSAYRDAQLTASSTLKQKMQALSGKPLGVISAGGENAEVWDYLFHLAGLPRSELKTVALNSPDANLAALKQGTITATNLGGTGPGTAVSDGYAAYLVRLDEGQVPAMNQVVSDVMVASTSYYQQHPDVVKAFVAAYKKAITYTYAHPAAAASLVYTRFPKQFSDEGKTQFMNEYNLLIQQKQLDASQTISSGQMKTLGTFLAATGQSIPSNWKQVFEKP